MTVNKGFSAGAVVMILAVVFVGIYALNGGTLSLGNHSVTTTNGGGAPSVTTCPQTQNFLAKAQYIDYTQTPAQPTLIASQTINVYIPGSGTVQFSGTSLSTAGTVIPSSGNINCNSNYLIGSGDGSTYLHNYVSVNSGTNSSVPVTLTLLKYAAPVLTLQNSSATALSAQSVFHKATAGETLANIDFAVQAGTGFDSSGQVAVIFIYNSLAISNINIQGATPISTGLLPAVSYVTSNSLDTRFKLMGSENTAKAFLLPQASYSQYTGATGASASTQTITPVITLSGSYAINETIGMEIVPADNYFNPATGTVNQNVYINPTTQAALVTPVTDANAIVISNK